MLGGIANQRGDPQPELQRREVAVQVLAQRLEPFDPLPHAVERLTPEKLDVGFGGGYPLSRLRSAAEVELGVPTLAADRDLWHHGGFGDPEMLALIGDVLFGP